MSGSDRSLMVRIRFTGADSGLAKVLDGIAGASHRAGAEILKTRRALREQKGELRDVQRELSSSSGNVTGLIDKERRLETSIAGVNRQLERQTKILGINRTVSRAKMAGEEMVAAGRTGLFSAVAMGTPLFAAAKAGAEFQATQNKMRVLGLGTGAVDDLTAFAKAMDVAGSSVNENMRYLLEAQGVFRESGEHNLADQLAGAKLMGPLLAKMSVTSKALGREISEDQERYFLRFVEQAGGLTDSKRAAELTDGLFRALQSSGGNVQAQNYQGFLAAAGSAGTHLSNRSMFADFEPLIAELHEQAGVGLSSAYNRATGITKNAAAAKDFMKLGIWDPSKVVLNSMGGVKEFKGNPLSGKAGELLARDPIEFYREVILPAYTRAGIKGEEVTRENSMLFGRGGGKLFNLIDKQLPTILHSRSAYQKTQGLDTAYRQTSDGFFGQEGKLRAAGKDFLVAAGAKGGLLDNVTSLMKSATAGLRAFTAWGEANPRAFSWLGTIVTDLLLMKVGLAAVKIAFGGLLGPAAQAWGLYAKIRTAGSVAEAFPTATAGARGAGKIAGRAGRGIRRIARVAKAGILATDTVQSAIVGIAMVRAAAMRLAGGLRAGAAGAANLAMKLGALAVGGIASGVATAFGVIRAAAIFLGQGMMRAGMMMLANPMVLIIAGIAAAIGVAAYLIYTHWDKIKGAFGAALTFLSGLWTKFKDFGGHLIQGLVDGITEKLALVKKAVVGAASAAIGWFKDKLGIHSPSRVFFGLGGHVMTGLAHGLRAGEAYPLRRLDGLARRMADTMTAGTAALALGAAPAAATTRRPAAAPASAAPGAAAPLLHIENFTVNTQPGQKPDEFAKAVRRELERLMAQAGARQRSSLADEPDYGSPL